MLYGTQQTEILVEFSIKVFYALVRVFKPPPARSSVQMHIVFLHFYCATPTFCNAQCVLAIYKTPEAVRISDKNHGAVRFSDSFGLVKK